MSTTKDDYANSILSITVLHFCTILMYVEKVPDLFLFNVYSVSSSLILIILAVIIQYNTHKRLTQ